MRRIAVVEHAFDIAGRGVIVAPDVDLGPGPRRILAVELRRPDGSTALAEAHAEVPFIDPPRARPTVRHVLRFASLTKAELPAGTEIWLVEAAG